MLSSFKRLIEYRELLLSLALRDIKVRYKQSILGITWTVLQPLSMMIIFTIIFTKFVKISTGNIPYPLFSYSALLPWGFFSTSLMSAIPSVVGNMGLVTKIYFPREIFPISTIMARFVDFLIASVIFVGLMLYYQVPLSFKLFLVVIVILIQIILTLGIVLFASALNVFFRDVTQVVPLITQIWMYLTPVIYPISLVPEEYRGIYMLNPTVVLIDSYRKIILLRQFPNFGQLGLAAAISLVLFYFSYLYFKSAEMKFADII